MNENLSWRMFSSLQMAGKDLEMFSFPKQSNASIPVQLSDHFNALWVRQLTRGPKWILHKASLFLCDRIPSAKKIEYRWYIHEWGGANSEVHETVVCAN